MCIMPSTHEQFHLFLFHLQNIHRICIIFLKLQIRKPRRIENSFAQILTVSIRANKSINQGLGTYLFFSIIYYLCVAFF